MTRALSSLLSLAVVLPASFAASPDDFPEIEGTVLAYLHQDCGASDEDPGAPLARVVALGPRAIPPLVTAAEEGPPASERAAAAAQSRGLRRKVRERERRRAVAAVPVVDRDEEAFVAGEWRRYALGYRERALHALGALGGAEAARALDGLRDKLPAELRKAWQEAAGRRAGVGSETGRTGETFEFSPSA